MNHRPHTQVVDQAATGSEAVEKARQLKPDVILMDLGLPGLNGIEAAQQIWKTAREAKIIFVTQESSVEVIREAIRLGASGYVLKSHAASDLLLAVETVTRGKKFSSKGLEALSA